MLLSESLKKYGGAISIDNWTDDFRRIPYMAMTCHFIEEKDNDIIFHDRILCVRAQSIDVTKTGSFILSEVKKILAEFSLLDSYLSGKIAVVTDRGPNIVNAFKNENNRLNCFIHFINNITQKCCKLPSAMSILVPVRGTVRYMKVTGLNNLLAETLKSFVRTRFNTNVDMLDSVQRNWDALIKILNDKGEMTQLQKVPPSQPPASASHSLPPPPTPTLSTNNKKRGLTRNKRTQQPQTNEPTQSQAIERPEYVEKGEIEMLVDFLSIFKEASDNVEQTKRPTLYLVWIWVIRIKEHLEAKTSDPRLIQVMKKVASDYFEKEFVFHRYYKAAVFLHPLFKGLHKFCETQREKEAVYSIVTAMINTEHLVIQANPVVDNSSTTNLSSFDSFLDSHIVFDNADAGSLVEAEVNAYKSIVVSNENFDLLNWWNKHKNLFPNLHSVAIFIHAIPATSASAERAFSSASNHITEKRSNINPCTADALIFLNNNCDFFEKNLNQIDLN